MSKILLAQPKLKPGFIDLSVGEPHLIRDILLDEIDINKCLPTLKGKDFIYQSPCGYDNLVEKLEEKHGHKVVITNGAKQGLAAAFYAAKCIGAKSIATPNPYWALLPPLAELHGLEFSDILKWKVPCADVSCLAVAPNNPDGLVLNLKEYENICIESGAIMIHDAAYYTGIYMEDLNQKVYGDAQVYSISKMFGLSSLRLGYVVCKNEEMYNHIQYYMEHMTVGVSKLSQMFLLNIINSINMEGFEKKCFKALQENKRIASTISSSILEIEEGDNTAGMFLWAKVKNKDAFRKAKLHIIDSEPFGKKGYVRINLAFDKDKMQEIVNKLNATK